MWTPTTGSQAAPTDWSSRWRGSTACGAAARRRATRWGHHRTQRGQHPLRREVNRMTWGSSRPRSRRGQRDSSPPCRVRLTSNASPSAASPPPQPNALAESWDGTAWATLPLPAPTGAQASWLTGVSCPRVRDCTAVGWLTTTDPDNATPMAARWDGRSWSVDAVPLPTGARSGSLSAVSCAADNACIAVGSDTTRWRVVSKASRRTGPARAGPCRWWATRRPRPSFTPSVARRLPAARLSGPPTRVALVLQRHWRSTGTAAIGRSSPRRRAPSPQRGTCRACPARRRDRVRRSANRHPVRSRPSSMSGTGPRGRSCPPRGLSTR